MISSEFSFYFHQKSVFSTFWPKKAFFCTVPPFGRLSTHVLRLTIQWYAGNIMCKLLMMFRTGGYILSSLLLVVLSIDRSVNNLSGIISNVDITSPHVQTQVQLASLCICVWLYCPSDNLVWIKKLNPSLITIQNIPSKKIQSCKKSIVH